MYGKIFEDIFCSTLMDFGGDTAYVFIAMIVLSDENGVIKHTVESLARMICKDVDSVRAAVRSLETQDPQSNIKAHNGRRIVPLHEIVSDETRGWLIVNKTHYREKRDPSERRDYMREYMRKLRADSKALADVSSGKQKLTVLADTDTDTDTDTKKDSRASRFEEFWKAYPRKKSKGDAEKAWNTLKPNADLLSRMLEAIARAAASADWTKDEGKFIPYPATWLRDKGWEDEIAGAPAIKVDL